MNKITVEKAKEKILESFKNISENERPKTGQGLISARVANRFFDPHKNQEEYKEIYMYTFNLLS